MRLQDQKLVQVDVEVQLQVAAVAGAVLQVQEQKQEQEQVQMQVQVHAAGGTWCRVQAPAAASRRVAQRVCGIPHQSFARTRRLDK